MDSSRETESAYWTSYLRRLYENYEGKEFICSTIAASSEEDNQNKAASLATTSKSENEQSTSSEDESKFVSKWELTEKFTWFEYIESLWYNHIYYAGLNKKRKIDPIRGRKYLPNRLDLFFKIYNDKEGFYRCTPKDHIAYRYEIGKSLGSGTYGDVIRAFDHKYGKYVALKIGNARYPANLYQEIQVLLHVKKAISNSWEFTVVLKTYFCFRQHNCLVFDLFPTDIQNLLYNQYEKQIGFSMPIVKRLTKSLLISLAQLHQHCIMHGDLKPGNLLKCRGKIDIRVS